MSDGWQASIERGRMLWHWTVERDPSWYDQPIHGFQCRGDSLSGIAFTRAHATRKARKWLANRIEWSKPKPDRREWVSLNDDPRPNFVSSVPTDGIPPQPPQPGQPTMNLLHPEVKGIFERGQDGGTTDDAG